MVLNIYKQMKILYQKIQVNLTINWMSSYYIKKVNKKKQDKFNNFKILLVKKSKVLVRLNLIIIVKKFKSYRLQSMN